MSAPRGPRRRTGGSASRSGRRGGRSPDGDRREGDGPPPEDDPWGDGDPPPEDDPWGDGSGGGRRFRWGWEGRAPSRPIPVAGGIAARSRRGVIGETWWSRRFLAAVEAVTPEGRIARGRTYARKGQVIDLRVDPGIVRARVQGSRTAPYQVLVTMPVAPDHQWERVLEALAARAGHAARLLAGELPHEVEAVFDAEGATLLPSRTSRLASDCSCPDWASPCKHVAAVCYLMAEAFDADPFLLLAWRGRDRAAVLDRLRELRAGAAGDAGAFGAGGDADGHGEPVPPDLAGAPPLAECLAEFWGSAGAAEEDLLSPGGLPAPAPLPDAVLRQLPRGRLAVGGRDVAELLAPWYRDMVEGAVRQALGGALSDRRRRGSSSRGTRRGRAPGGG